MNSLGLNHRGEAPQLLVSCLAPKHPERLTMPRSRRLQPIAARVRAARLAAGLTPEEFVRKGASATNAEMTAFDAELGSVREDCGVPA